MTPDLIVGLVVLVTLFALEGVLPFYRGKDRAGRARISHGLRNGTLMLVNGAVGALLAPLVLGVIAFGNEAGIGLGHWLTATLGGGPSDAIAVGPGGALVSTVAVLLAFDLWMYLWHRANHEIGLLWRFHQVHHTDRAMDSTTALRFHPGELVLSTLLNLPVLLLLGLSLGQFVLYKSLMLSVILLHHSNLRLPVGVDRRLGWVLVPPSMHRVHHSRIRRETDANYGTLFSFWDRLFGSFRRRPDQADIAFGTGQRDDDAWQTPWRLLLLPLQPATGATAARPRGGQMTQRPELIFVYNADSGLFNSVADAAHKVISPATYACNLCQVTWGWFTERTAWRAFIAGLDADCQFLHRDEFRARFPAQAIALPAVLRRDGDRLAVCIDAATLNGLPDLDALIALVRAAVSGHAP